MNIIELQPEELFFLAQQMKAEYIDYMYISAMKDISKKFALHHKEWIDSLEKRNVICEDFDGNISIDLDVENALKPVLFGETEVSVGVCDVDSGVIEINNFHFLNDSITAVNLVGDKFVFESISKVQFKEKIESRKRIAMLGQDDNKEDSIEVADVRKILTIKYAAVNKDNRLEKYLITENATYCDGENDCLINLSQKTFDCMVSDVLKEVI